MFECLMEHATILLALFSQRPGQGLCSIGVLDGCPALCAQLQERQLLQGRTTGRHFGKIASLVFSH
jgi:hypothetical protein